MQGIGEKLPEIARNIRIENWRVKTKSVIELSPDTYRAGENETCRKNSQVQPIAHIYLPHSWHFQDVPLDGHVKL